MKYKGFIISVFIFFCFFQKSQAKYENVTFKVTNDTLEINYFTKKNSSIEAMIYVNTGIKYSHLFEVKMIQYIENRWYFKYPIPSNALSYLVIFRDSLNDVDNNRGEGYWGVIKKDDIPLKGALASIADMYAGWRHNAIGIDNRNEIAINLYQQEFSQNPDIKRRHYLYYLFALKKNKSPNFISELSFFSSLTDLDEQELRFASLSYKELGNDSMSKFLRNRMFERYPEHPNILDQLSIEIRKEFYENKFLDDKKSIYMQFVRDYCFVRDSNGRARMRHYQAQMLADLCKYYCKTNTFQDWLKEVNLLDDNSLLQTTYWLSASDLLLKEIYLDKAELLAYKAIELGELSLSKPRTPLEYSDISNTEIVKLRKQHLAHQLDTYGQVLRKINKKEQSCIVLQKAAVEYGGRNIPNINQHYVEILKIIGNNELAADEVKKMKDQGHSTPQIDKAYLNNEPSNHQNLSKKLYEGELINEKIKPFSLIDKKGRLISKDSLIGKVIVIDFWATWCGSCISGFEGMYNLMSKFKNNNEVMFLFVNTFEFGENVQQKALNTIEIKGYSIFNVLFDNKDMTASLFKVSALPTKVVMDKNGNIRFRQIGNGLSNETIQLEGVINKLLID